MTNRVKLTDRLIRTLKSPEKGRQAVYDIDNPGLSLVISARGRKTWRYVYTVGGRKGQRDQLTIGTYPEISLAQVREIYRIHRASIQQGINPAHQKKIERTERLVKDLVTDYFVSHRFQLLSEKHRLDVERAVKREILPALGKYKAREVTRGHIRDIVEAIRDRGAPIMANRILAYIRAIFSWALDREIVDVNPCSGIRTDVKEIPRDRVLSSDEIRRFWKDLDNTGMTEVIKGALRLQLITAQRKGEIAKAQWSHINFLEKIWTIPAGNAKNRKLHRIPLSDMAIFQFEQMRKFADDSPWVFPSLSNPDEHVKELSITRALARARKTLNLEDLTPHDLRRTAATMLAKNGAEREYIKKILNHVDGSVTSIYDRYSYDDEKRRYLDLWADQLKAILDYPTHSNVVNLR